MENWQASLNVRRVVNLLACLALLFRVAGLSGPGMVAIPAVGLAAALLEAGALALFIASALTSRDGIVEQLETALLALTCLEIALRVVAFLHFAPPYATDEAALLQGAGTLLLHGHNPYGASLVSFYTALHVPPFRFTPLASGGFVHSVDYPGLAVMIAALSVWATHGYESIVIADTMALVAATLVTFALLPRHLRGLALIVTLAVPGLLGYALAGFVAVLALPLLSLAVWRWDAIGNSGRLAPLGVAQAAALGLSCGISQLAWLLAPFLVLVVWRERQFELGWRRGTLLAGRFGLIAGATFLAPNVPFIVANAGKWLENAGAPVLQHSIPFGLGLAALPLLAHIGGGYLAGYSLGAGLLYLALMGLTWLWVRRLRTVALVLPVLPVFVATRALPEYWGILVPVWLVAAATVGSKLSAARVRGAHERAVSIGVKLAVVGLTMAALFEVGAAIASPAPLSVRITSAPVSSTADTISAMEVRVRNATAVYLTPHFVVNIGIGQVVWTVRSGPRRLPPHHTAVYEIAAPGRASRVPITAFAVDILTNDPVTLSVSPLHIP